MQGSPESQSLRAAFDTGCYPDTGFLYRVSSLSFVQHTLLIFPTTPSVGSFAKTSYSTTSQCWSTSQPSSLSTLTPWRTPSSPTALNSIYPLTATRQGGAKVGLPLYVKHGVYSCIIYLLFFHTNNCTHTFSPPCIYASTHPRISRTIAYCLPDTPRAIEYL